MDKVKTDRPVMDDRSKITRDIANFWNKTSLAVRAVWGPHIHHGYYETCRETPIEAQEKLIEKLGERFKIAPQDRILDVGCGMGGSSLYLAKRYSVTVEGVTLSQKQVEIATQSAKTEQIDTVSFKIEDALSLASFADNSFDIVWSLESCEQFYDKKLFIQQAFRVLKPGGSLMLATWCSSGEEYEGPQAQTYIKLCNAIQVPYMPTIKHYAILLQQQGFAVKDALDWSRTVEKTLEIGLDNLHAHSLFTLFMMSGWRGLFFRRQAKMMRRGFDERTIEYGVFVAQK